MLLAAAPPPKPVPTDLTTAPPAPPVAVADDVTLPEPLDAAALLAPRCRRPHHSLPAPGKPRRRRRRSRSRTMSRCPSRWTPQRCWRWRRRQGRQVEPPLGPPAPPVAVADDVAAPEPADVTLLLALASPPGPLPKSLTSAAHAADRRARTRSRR